VLSVAANWLPKGHQRTTGAGKLMDMSNDENNGTKSNRKEGFLLTKNATVIRGF